MRPWPRAVPPQKSTDELTELRRLLVRPEQEDLRALRARLDNKERRAHEVAEILPEAVTLTGRRSEELARALRPAVEDSVRASVEKRPQFLVDALHPIIGPIVRRSIAENFRALLQSLNQALERSFSWQGLKWRIEAWRTGRSFSEVVLLRSLVYRVEQIFLIHRETGASLLHVIADSVAAEDPAMVAAMQTAITDFVHDSFKGTKKDEALDEFRVGELNVWIERGPQAYLAAVVRGTPPRELRGCLEDAIERIHVLRGSDLLRFKGEAAPFESLGTEIEPCLRAQYQPKKAAASHARAWFALSLGAALLVAALIVGAASERRWDGFIRKLNAAPGIAVTQAKHHWLRRSFVSGLRDPAIADPFALAREAGLNPERLRFEWKNYLALDDPSVLRRFVRRFGKPPETTLTLADGMLTLLGKVPYEWLEHVRSEGRQVPGITSIHEQNVEVIFDPARVLERFREKFPPPPALRASYANGILNLSGTVPWEWIDQVRSGATGLPGIKRISEENLKIAYDPALVLRRFIDRFNLPDSVNANVNQNVLVLEGEAPHAWLTRVRRGAPSVPGISTVNEEKLIDLDQRTFQQSKAVIESAFVYFLLNKENFATEGFAALSRLPDEIRRCLSAASRLGLEVQIEVRGYADSVGEEKKNLDLSQRRSNAVKDFLVKCGFEPSLFRSMGIGAPPPPAAGEAQPEQADRRVAFKIVPKT